ncbi:hypothetical protein HYS49_01125 [Candidatus Woesearchaeota archaeon]|nr:hypothetical protein [Candidatus Woesearchaeota archaeon]
MDESLFLDYVGDHPRMRIVQHFIEGRDFDFTLTDLLHAGVSWGTLNTMIPKLVAIGIIVKTRKIGRATLYKINQENLVAQHFLALYDQLLLENLNQIEEAEMKIAIPA